VGWGSWQISPDLLLEKGCGLLGGKGERLEPREFELIPLDLARCLKALDTRAPIRARVQHELAEVRVEEGTRGGTGKPAAQRHYDAAGLTTGELERTRRELAASLALARPGSPARAPIQTQMAAIDAELAARNTLPT